MTGEPMTGEPMTGEPMTGEPMTGELELRLIGADSPDGEIRARDLAVIADALQELRIRIGRELLNSPGPGRTPHFMEEIAALRLRHISAGSTRLGFTTGPTDKLDLSLAEQDQFDRLFQEIVEAIRDDRRPDWATDLIADSAARLVDGLKAAAPHAVIRIGDLDQIDIESARIHRETWVSTRLQTSGKATAKGRLEKVDLRSHDFRVRDDVGTAVELHHVQQDTSAAQLVGQWVVATGLATVNSSGRVIALDEVRVDAVADPAAAYLNPPVESLESILASAPGPDPNGGIELTDEEFDAFLQAAHS